MENRGLKKLKISFILNIATFALLVFAVFVMLSGWQFMGHEMQLVAVRIQAFRYFTVDSNVLAGLASLVMLIYEARVLRGQTESLPRVVIAFKQVACVGVALTMIVVAVFLAPAARGGYFSLFKNTNLFMHLLIPLVCIISFVFFESTKKLRFAVVFAGMIPMFLYAVYYCINIALHLENGKISGKYDWYGFAIGGIRFAPVSLAVIFSLTFLISLLLWLFNRKCSKNGEL